MLREVPIVDNEKRRVACHNATCFNRVDVAAGVHESRCALVGPRVYCCLSVDCARVMLTDETSG